jgi:hypothetical protein
VLKFLLVVALFAAVVYAAMWALERRRAGGSGTAPILPRRGPRPQPRQAAPDDDEDFLRWLGDKRRKDTGSTEP